MTGDRMNTTTLRTALAVSSLLALAACNNNAQDGADPQPTATPSATGTASILRPDVEAETAVPMALEPLSATVGFPEGGAELAAEARAAIDALLESEQVAKGWPITLGGHSDAGGSDAANLRASEARAQAVADYMVEKGVAESRITIVSFGEQNPVAPNARPDGEPDEEGRARNRRVDIVIAESGGLENFEAEAEEEDAPQAQPTETLSETITKAVTPSD